MLFLDPRQVLPFPKAGQNTHTHREYHPYFRIWKEETSEREIIQVVSLELFLTTNISTFKRNLLTLFSPSSSVYDVDMVCNSNLTVSELGYLPLHSVCGCWWWRPGHLMKPRGAPPQPAWPWQAGLPALTPWAFHSSTNHLNNKHNMGPSVLKWIKH